MPSAQPGGSLLSRYGEETTHSVYTLCPRPVGRVNRGVQKAGEWRLELMRTEMPELWDPSAKDDESHRHYCSK